jgi:ATP-dependent protease ClpP protease subunit
MSAKSKAIAALAPPPAFKIHARMKPFFGASLQSDGTLELLIYEELGENWWTGGGITAKTVKDQIDQAGNYSKIVIRINSPGGDAFEGIAIYNVVRAQKKPVEVRVDGIAASAASIVAMAGDEIVMGPNAMMMIHNAWGMAVGNAADMRQMAGALDKISGAIAQTYVTKTQKTIADIQSMMDAETWLTAQECVQDGFATHIVSDKPGDAAALAMARRFKNLRGLKNVPDTLKAAENADGECQCECPECMDGDCGNCTNADCVDENCLNCPMQQNAAARVDVSAPAVAESNLSLYEARAKMLLRRVA